MQREMVFTAACFGKAMVAVAVGERVSSITYAWRQVWYQSK